MRVPAEQKLWLRGLAIFGGLILLGSGASLHSRAPAGAPTLLRIEPELNGVFNTGTRAHPGAGPPGSGYISIDGWDVKAPDYGRKIAGETAYPFEVSVPRNYYSWVRAKWLGTCSNSITLTVAPRSVVTRIGLPERHDRNLVGNDLVFGEWHWVRGPAFDLRAGAYDCFIGTRESQVSVDCVVLTVDEDFDPAAATLAASAGTSGTVQEAEPFLDNFTSGVDGWLFGRSEWLLVRESGLSAFGPVHAKLSLAQARTAPVRGARVECSVQLSPRVCAGVFFGRQSADDYFVARLCGSNVGAGAAGKLQICQQNGDTAHVLAEAPIPPWNDAQWELLTVWFYGKQCYVYVTNQAVLRAELPRDATGSVGMYVDGGDSILRPLEVPEHIAPRPERRMTLADFQPLPEIGPQAWPGLIVPLSRDESLVLRWTNLGRAEAYAKRVELVRSHTDGTVEVLGERWGIFGPEMRQRLSVDWSLGRVRASVGGSIFATCSTLPAEDVGGLISVRNPRAMFGDFVLEPLTFELSKGLPSAYSVPFGARQRALRLGLRSFSTGVLTTCIGARGLPFAWVFDLDQNGIPDTLGISAAGSGTTRVWFAMNGRRESRLIEQGEGNRSILQAYFDYGEFRAYANGQLVIHEGRRTSVIQDVTAVGGLASTRTAYSSLSERPSFFALGYGWPSGSIGGRELIGDAMIRIRGRDPNPHAGRLTMQLHSAKKSRGSGYEFELNKAGTVTWLARRNGVVISEGTMASDDLVNLRWYLLGSVLTFDANQKPVFRCSDPDPLRSGYVNVNGLATPYGVEDGVTLQQPWDTRCVFNQEVNALASMALWAPRAGDWALAEDPKHLRGYLLGRSAGGKQAVLEYRGSLEAADVLAELRVDRSMLRHGHRLSVSMGDRHWRPCDIVLLAWPNPSTVTCSLRRDQNAVESEAKIDLKSSAPVFTILRTRGELRLYLDHTFVARVQGPHEGGIEKLWLEIETPSGESLAIPSICIQENPMAPLRLPRGRGQLLAFLDYVARRQAAEESP